MNRLRPLASGSRREHRDDKVRGLLVRQQRTRVTYVVTTDVHDQYFSSQSIWAELLAAQERMSAHLMLHANTG